MVLSTGLAGKDHPRQYRLAAWLVAGGVLLGLGGFCLPLAAEELALDQVALPLAEYLALVEKAEALEKAQKETLATREQKLAEVVAQRTSLVWQEPVSRPNEGEAEMLATTTLEVLIQGEGGGAVWLPIAGYLESSDITREGLPRDGSDRAKPAAALAAVKGAGKVLIATSPGKFRVQGTGRLPWQKAAGGYHLALPEVVAPIALAEIELPAELEWRCPGAVVVGDEVRAVSAAGESRQHRFLRLAASKGQRLVLETRRRFVGQEAEKVLAHTTVLTLFQLRPEGPRRHDVVFYEVARGQLASLAVELPPGLEVEQAATDEGAVLPLVDGRRLKVERRQRLAGAGYLVLTSTPAAGEGGFAWQIPAPEFEVRSRYLATAAALAAVISPEPVAAFQQVDLEDLPPALREALQAADLAAAWRATSAEPSRLTVAPLPAAAMVALAIVERETTTLMTVDGTLLHRELLTLAPSSRPLSALELSLPQGSTLWSAKLDGEPIRPLERQGKLSVPLTLRNEALSTVEVVTVLDRALGPGREQLQIELARVEAPVLRHTWKVLLPEGRRYRYHRGDLSPAPEPIVGYGAVDRVSLLTAPEPADDLVVTNEAPALLDQRLPSPAPPPAERYEPQKVAAQTSGRAKTDLDELQRGLVGGIRPLPITIPESGKVLYLTGILPPAAISLVVDVKAKN